MDYTFDDLLIEVEKHKASDLHISAGTPPIIRLRGKLTRLKGYPALTTESIETMLTGLLSGDQNEKLNREKELDFSYFITGVARFRGNIFREKRSLAAAFRMIPTNPLPFEALGVPGIIKELADKQYGLILVTGPSGSGKTTTLAALVDYMNNTRNSHVVTIEDPVEYVFQNRTCLIRQREIGVDTTSFSRALISALRQDPDVILVGEMRDKETMETALTAAETGHLVISTLHTNNAVDTINRILDVFPGHKQTQIRVQLAATLQGVFSQLLLPHRDKNMSMALATEVLIVTPGIRNMIREGSAHMIHHAIETGSEYGMQTMEVALKKLYEEGKVTLEEALIHAYDPQSFRKMMGLDTKSHDEESGELPSDARYI
ncbi:MAG: type IV pilus twitching motility protein PilT [Candidatus Eremiobacteraeota bacterium]|nr:type IV pilus twitching motility protein PilT [Candidatus Eremiobacteraeota bacterium]